LATKPSVAGWHPAARGGIPVESRIPASERTSQKLNLSEFAVAYFFVDGVAERLLGRIG
jgi:hypothetical protein